MAESPASSDPNVKLFHASLLWPIHLEPLVNGGSDSRHWEVFEHIKESQWSKLDDEFTEDPGSFKERHYREFVTFLPYVQRFLYGEGRSRRKNLKDPPRDSPLRIYRREDISRLRLTLSKGDVPIELRVVHLDLYFFHDLDLAILNVEVCAEDMALSKAREILFRFGRAYPAGWDADGNGLHNAYSVQWLRADGAVIAASDTGNRGKYLEYACEHRSPCISEHWAYLLRPMALAHSDEPGRLRYRLIEYHRMPTMAYLAVENPRCLSHEDWVRIGMATVMRPDEALPLHDPDLRDFETRYCQDRYWLNTAEGPNTRFMCTGNALTVVGEAASSVFLDGERGVKAQFRHQYFIIFLIAHLHRAALLVFSDVLVDSVNDLDVRKDYSVKVFKRRIRANFEVFLRFTHRYWFHEISERTQVQAVFRLCSGHLRNDDLYAEVRDEIREMSHYLDSDSQRRQSNTVVRLTVITILGLIATVTTGYFGMNIIAFGEGPVSLRVLHGLIATTVFVSMVLFAIARSKQLSDFLEALADEKLGVWKKARVFWRIFSRRERIED